MINDYTVVSTPQKQYTARMSQLGLDKVPLTTVAF